MDALKYPIGRLSFPETISDELVSAAIADIGALPEKILSVLQQMGETALDQPYRPGGWTGRQVIHHIADSHMNALIRFKLALTEDNPTIKPYKEALWANLPDYTTSVDPSLQLISAIHNRLELLLSSLSNEQWERTFYHPENKSSITLRKNVLLYQWHGNHHLGHLNLIAAANSSL
nr:putative metal-dependent hydrolase [Cytophagales bacterium]